MIIALLLLKTARACSIWQLLDELSTMVVVSTAAEGIKIYDSESKVWIVHVKLFMGPVFSSLFCGWTFFRIHVNFSFIAHLNMFI